jgi:hypothetical protein
MKWLASIMHSASTSSGHIRFLLVATTVFGCALMPDANADMKVAQGGGGPAGNWGPPGHVTIIPFNGGVPCYVDQPPRGSYQRSCERVTWDCKTLSAWCKPRQGGEEHTFLDPSTCIGDIANMDGELHCSKGGSPPGGSYTQSCQDIYVDNGVLHANCRQSNGSYPKPPSHLDNFASCRTDIENNEGTLKCR